MDKSRTAKVIIIGDINVGKTSLMFRFTKGSFSGKSVTTIGCASTSRTIAVGDHQMRLNVWDTAGQERYRSLTSGFYRNVNGVILMLDVNNKNSYLGLNSWVREIEYQQIKLETCLLVGNKADRNGDRQVNQDEVKALAKSLGLDYLETSAKDNLGVDQAFDTLARKMLEHSLENQPSQMQEQTHVLSSHNTNNNSNKGKCKC